MNERRPGDIADGPAGSGPHTIANRHDFAAELSVLRNRAGKPIRRLAKELDQPLATIGGYFSGNHVPSVSQMTTFQALLGALGVTDDAETMAWIDAAARVRRQPGPRSSREACPYPGLESFQPHQSEVFFGREELTDVLVRMASEKIKRSQEAVLAVVGPSGSGKSSILHAGLMPAAAQGRIVPTSQWRSIALCPGEHPLENLLEALTTVTDVSANALRRYLSDGDQNLNICSETGGLLMVIDQFEELFSTCPDESRRQEFLNALQVLATPKADGLPPVVVALALRADFYARATREPLLVPVLQNNQVVVGPMTRDELRRAIVGPARHIGHTVDDDLVEVVLAEFAPRDQRGGAHEPGALPLLSHALRETWGAELGTRMSLSAYRATGGIAGAVQQTAERAFEELDPVAQDLARRAFLRLVTIEEDVVMRRRVSRRDLPGCTCASSPTESCPLNRIIDRFLSARLLTAEKETVEISHEALLTAWPRLRRWIDDDREGIRIRRRLSEAAGVWMESGHDAATLLRGGRLELVGAWAYQAENWAALTPSEQSFLDSSNEQAEMEKRSAKARLRRLQLLIAIVATLALVSAGLARLAIGARDAANETRDLALSRQLAVQSAAAREADPSLAAQLALTGYQVNPSLEARSALLDTTGQPASTRLIGEPGSNAVAVRGDAGFVAVARLEEDSTTLLRLSEHGLEEAGTLGGPDEGGEIFTASFNAEGDLLATGRTDNLIRLWNVDEPTKPTVVSEPLQGFEGPVQSVAFSPNGDVLAGAGTAPGILLWKVDPPGNPVALPPLTGMSGTTQTVAFSPDGDYLAAGGTDGVVRIWSGATDGPAPFAEMPLDTAATINTISFSNDGRYLAAGSKDQSVRVWDLSGPVPELVGDPLTGFGSWVNSVAFSDDGRVLAAGSSDNTIRFWSVGEWKELKPSLRASAPVTNIAFVPGTTDLFSAAIDGITRLWTWPGPVIAGGHDNVFGISYDASGDRMAILANHAKSVPIWDTSNPAQPNLAGTVDIPDRFGTVGATGDISADGTRLATGMRDLRVHIWDIEQLAETQLLRSLDGPAQLIEQTEFSPDGSMLAGGSDDGTVRLWDLDSTSPAPTSTLEGPTNLVLGIAFSPDGSHLAAASADGSVWLWSATDATSPALLDHLTPFENYAYSVAFSQDGKVLAAGSADKTIRFWDLTDPADPQPLGSPLTGPGNNVYSLAFSPTEPVLSAAARWNAVAVRHFRLSQSPANCHTEGV